MRVGRLRGVLIVRATNATVGVTNEDATFSIDIDTVEIQKVTRTGATQA